MSRADLLLGGGTTDCTRALNRPKRGLNQVRPISSYADWIIR